MPGSRGNERPSSATGASRDRLAEWEAGAFSALRHHRDAATPVDDELPEEAWRDPDEMRSALSRLPSA